MREEDGGISRHFRRKSLRWKYVLIKESLDMAIEELDRWHATADPSWYLLLRISNNKIDQALTIRVNNAAPAFPMAIRIREARRYTGDSGVFLPPRDLDSMLISDIRLSTAKLAQRRSSKGVQNLILTSLECPAGSKVDLVAKTVQELAQKLAVNDPLTFGLLSCKGVVRANRNDGRPTAFTMVFRSPQNNANVSSLRNEFLANNNLITFGDKFAFARQLAKSISYIHTLGFIHKSVRPENILIFREADRITPPSAYLAGFDSFRKEDGRTYRQGVYEWERNLYQHPSRQGLSPREDCVMQHDIYSLRVCLLEIRLWESFTDYDSSGRNPTASRLLNPFALDCQAGRVGINDTKDYLVRLYRERLSQNMGPKYRAVVETYLTCLDPENVDFGDEREFVDNDGIQVGVRYIEKVGGLFSFSGGQGC